MRSPRASSPGRTLCLGLLVCGLFPGAAHAKAFPYWGVSFGTPERTAAHLGVSFGRDIPGDAEGFAIGTGPVVEVSAGMGGGSLGVGRSLLILPEDSIRVYADVKAVATRTWDKPRAASPHATYVGIEGGLSVAFVRLNVGVAKRVEQKTRGANVLFTWGAGIQIRIGSRRPSAHPPEVNSGR
ncbi:MAG: hypothetical protein ABI672_14475 [Vicinamibacteria bacterium]